MSLLKDDYENQIAEIQQIAGINNLNINVRTIIWKRNLRKLLAENRDTQDDSKTKRGWS